MSLKKNIILISGPTGSGKSNLAMTLASIANGEIINADSMQVYKDLKIITAQPSAEDQKKINHHLYGHKLGDVRYNVFDWCKECVFKIDNIISNKKLPIIVGGTGLYFHSLIFGISEIPPIPEYTKNNSSDMLEKYGWKIFFDKVQKLDPVSCSKISVNDAQRLKRIWEVVMHTNIPLSVWQKNNSYNFIKNYNYKFFLIKPNQKEIYNRCNNRFLKMIDQGVVDEVIAIKKQNYDSTLPIMKAHGVPEILAYLDNQISMQECTKRAQKVTRNYVKRQFTWWRGSRLKPDHLIDDFPENIDLETLDILKKITN